MSIAISQDRSLVFRQTFENGIRDVIENPYGKGTFPNTGISYGNNQAKITTGDIKYDKFVKYSSVTIRMIFNIKMTSGYKYLFDMRKFHTQAGYFKDTDSAIYLFIDPSNLINYDSYVNGVQIIRSNFIFQSNVRYEVVTIYNNVTSHGLRLFKTWSGSGQVNGNLELFEIYNRALSSTEIKQLYNKNLYSGSESKKLPLLLDFDSTREMIEDRTGRNVLTASNIEIKQIGKVKSAFSLSGNIVIPNNIINTSDITISIWFNMRKNPNYGKLIQLGDDGESFQVMVVPDGSLLTNSTGAAPSLVTNRQAWNKWHHLLVIRKGTFHKMILNGGVEIRSNILNSPVSVNKPVYIFGSTSGVKFKGYISKIQLFSGIPQDPDKFAAQLYNSQKSMFI